MSMKYDDDVKAAASRGEAVGAPPPGYIYPEDRMNAYAAVPSPVVAAAPKQNRRGPEATQARREANDRRGAKPTPEQRQQQLEALANVGFNNALAEAMRQVAARRQAPAAAAPAAAAAAPPAPPRRQLQANAAAYVPPENSVAASIDRFNAAAAAPAAPAAPPRRQLTQEEIDAIIYAPEGRRTFFLKPDKKEGEGHYRGCGIPRFDEPCYFN
jgi:hypothetical protein